MTYYTYPYLFQGKEKKPVRKHENGLDPLNDNEDEDVRRIAAEMEEKYVSQPANNIAILTFACIADYYFFGYCLLR